MKKKIIATLSAAFCLVVIGMSASYASNNFRGNDASLESNSKEAEARKRIKAIREEKETLKEDKIEDIRVSDELIKEEINLEMELGEYDYIADIKGTLNGLEAVLSDNVRAREELKSCPEPPYTDEQVAMLEQRDAEFLELVKKYSTIIENGDYHSPKELFNEYHREEDEIRNKYAFDY